MAAAVAPLISAVSSIAGGLLSGHVLRAKGATTENQAAAQLAPAIQADFEEIAQYLNTGQLKPTDAAAALMTYDAQVKKYLQSQVGKPGTAWTENGTCNKSCTVGCCLYFAFWHHAFTVFAQRAQAATPGSSFTVAMPAIPTNKYGFPGAPAFSVSVKIPDSGPAEVLTGGLVGTFSKTIQEGMSSLGLNSAPPTATNIMAGTVANSSPNPLKWVFVAVLAIVAIFLLAR
jgi:hypothetical protein